VLKVQLTASGSVPCHQDVALGHVGKTFGLAVSSIIAAR
jgi:hypothetical protein